MTFDDDNYINNNNNNNNNIAILIVFVAIYLCFEWHFGFGDFNTINGVNTFKQIIIIKQEKKKS